MSADIIPFPVPGSGQVLVVRVSDVTDPAALEPALSGHWPELARARTAIAVDPAGACRLVKANLGPDHVRFIGFEEVVA